MHLLITVNAAWNIWNFRRSLVAGLLSYGHRITVLGPPDGSVPDLERLGCRFLPLDMRVKGVTRLRISSSCASAKPAFGPSGRTWC